MEGNKAQEQQQYLAWIQYHASIASHCQRKLEEYITASYPEILAPFPESWPSSSSSTSTPSFHSSNSSSSSNSNPDLRKEENNTNPIIAPAPDPVKQLPIPKIFNRSPHPEDATEDLQSILALGPEIIPKAKRTYRDRPGKRYTSLSPTSPFFSYFDWQQPVHKPRHHATVPPNPNANSKGNLKCNPNPDPKRETPAKADKKSEIRQVAEAKKMEKERKRDMRPLVRERTKEVGAGKGMGLGFDRIWSRCWASQREKWNAVAVRTRSIASLTNTSPTKTLTNTTSSTLTNTLTATNTDTTTTSRGNRGEQRSYKRESIEIKPQPQPPIPETAEKEKEKASPIKDIHEYPRITYPEFARQGRKRVLKIAGRMRLSVVC